MIDSFSGKYRFLSNFWTASVGIPLAGGPDRAPLITLPTVEHAYQASKTDTFLQFLLQAGITLEEYVALTPGQAKRVGRKVTLRPDWDRIKLGVMERLLRQKFAPGTELAARLLRTGGQVLVEGNTWHDGFWGTCWCARCRHGTAGTNHLGQLLMKIRKELQDAQDPDRERESG